MDIGVRLRQIRKSQGKTLDEVAMAAQISQPFISQVENGNKIPSLATLEKLCQTYGLSLAEFFTPEDSPTFNISHLQEDIKNLSLKQKALLIRFLEEIKNDI